MGGTSACSKALDAQNVRFSKRERSKRGLLEDERLDIYEEVHPTLNAGINVSKLTCGSMRELVWLCSRTKRAGQKGASASASTPGRPEYVNIVTRHIPKGAPFVQAILSVCVGQLPGCTPI